MLKIFNMIGEEFKIIDDFPAYRISNKGKLQSRWVRGKHYSGIQYGDIWKELKTNRTKDDYPSCVLCDGYGKRKTIRIHILVAKYFLPPKTNNNYIIRHLDSNKLNNDVNNLSYGSYIDNENDKIYNGTWYTRTSGAKLTPAQVKEIRFKYNNGISQKSLSNEYGVTRPTITRICNNSIWKNI